MSAALSRRRVLTIAAAAAALGAAPRWPAAAGAGVGPQRWQGTALGAEATLLLYHPDPAAARRLIRACLAEIARLERVFSLHRADSALSVLNRRGVLDDPPQDLVRLLAQSRWYSRISGGAFDVTVQPLWRLYAGHFATPGADPAGPSAAAIARALGLVDHAALRVASHRIAFARPGMAVTLNGIAQGYITDRVAELLRGEGMDRVLINLGETRVLGRHPDGRAWRVGLADPEAPERTARTIEVEDQAVATSGGYGTRFDASGRHHHLFDPATGRSSRRYLAVTVVAPTATAADALSTALAVAPPARAQGALDAVGSARALFTLADGSLVVRASSA